MAIAIGNEKLKFFYQDMLLARRLEEKIGQLYVQQKFSGFCHLYIGQEAVSTGCLNALRKGEDYVISGYRDHVQPITLGMEPKIMVAELLGKATGCAGGRGGSMHMFSKDLRYYGGHGIVGGQVPLAAGMGWKIKYKKEDLVAVCFLGDAAINQGQFHEALNMSQIWGLPVIYIIENNLYGMGTAISRTCALPVLADRAKGYGMAQKVINGRDVIDTYNSMTEIVEWVRKNQQPILVEAQTYRFRGHSMSDPGHYRTKAELEKERDNDCIARLQKVLLEKKICQEQDWEKFEEDVAAVVEEAVEFAENSPEPQLSTLYNHVLV